MHRLHPLLPFVLLSACATSGAASEEGSTPPGAAAADVQASGEGSGGAAFDAEVVRTATTATTVKIMKLRLSDDGALTKQSVYHDAADSIPAPVRALASQKFPGAPVTGYETELYADLGRVYEVEVDQGGKGCEVAATADGAEVYTECEVEAGTLSDAAKATIERVAPGGKILEVETKTGPSIDEMTVEVEVGGRELYLRLGPDGALIQAMRRVPAVVELPYTP